MLLGQITYPGEIDILGTEEIMFDYTNAHMMISPMHLHGFFEMQMAISK